MPERHPSLLKDPKNQDTNVLNNKRTVHTPTLTKDQQQIKGEEGGETKLDRTQALKDTTDYLTSTLD